VIRENLQWRDDRHPDLWLYPSAGSIFQKIEGVGAGRLIDQCGLKGHVLGNAQIFHKHANIIVNLGGATAADVRALIDLAQRPCSASWATSCAGDRDGRRVLNGGAKAARVRKPGTRFRTPPDPYFRTVRHPDPRDVRGGGPLLAVHHLVLHPLALHQRPEAGPWMAL
jgi:hypothetical protein